MVIRVAILRHNGLFYGGTEKFLQIMAACCNKDEFEIDYFTTDEMRVPDRERYLLDNDVNVIKFKIGKKFEHYPMKFFNNLIDPYKDLWNKLDPDDYDVIQITNFGWNEQPYNSFKEYHNVCEFTVFPPYVKFSGVKYHILNSEWLRDEWIKTGGRHDNSIAIPVPVKKTTNEKLVSFDRKLLGISDDAIICGFHQRNDDNIFSDIQLQAFGRVNRLVGKDRIFMIVLNGSKKYREQADKLRIFNIAFLDYQNDVSPFLNTLDIYTHGRKDGETYGMVLAEAMLHGLPCISHKSMLPTGYNAMSSIIQDGGIVVDNLDDYTFELFSMVSNVIYRNNFASNAINIAFNNYTYDMVIPKIEETWRKVAGLINEKRVD